MNVETAVGLFMEHEQHSHGNNSTSMDSSGGGPGVDIRAPDETQTMRLMDDHGMAPAGLQGYADMMDDQDIVMSAFAHVDARAAVNAAAAAASDSEQKHSHQDKHKSEEMSGSLSDMFAPPTTLMHRGGGFQGARATARDARRWLLVNIQRDSEFACHALNRDVWRDELVVNLVREGFIFWQAVSQLYQLYTTPTCTWKTTHH